MKRNLILVIICALCLVNVALNAVMLISTMSANKKTVALINDISAVLDLELNPEAMVAGAGPSLMDTETYNIEDEMVVALAQGEDGQDHYAMVSVSFSIDKTSDDYAEMRPLLDENVSKIRSEIMNIIGGYTKEEARANQKGLEDAILEQIQSMFGSRFVYEVYFRDFKVQ
ncbi:MAG: flagellar basal body-associated FliL family protein [Lachnospiraceae bacterium]|nr:flagellar basal body-associated FliL family protein [Lachnospiraceae bacterium]MBR2275487.1 flagellar basal body-associated FliL family protein [Lachnospiraceae bacterium]